jgi:hypothetical protein
MKRQDSRKNTQAGRKERETIRKATGETKATRGKSNVKTNGKINSKRNGPLHLMKRPFLLQGFP